MKRPLLYLIIILGLSFVFSNLSSSEELTGDEIAERVYNRDDGNSSSWRASEMVLIDKGGGEIVRTYDTLIKDDQEGLAKRLIRFLSPGDIEGVAFLSWEKADQDDIQYLYLPEIGRPRKISGRNKTNSFVNSDFTYEDMQRRKADEDEHNLLKEEEKNSYNCFVVEYIPKKSYQYNKFIYWVDKESFVPIYIEHYDIKGRLAKILQIKKMEKISEIWTPLEIEMEDLRREHKTDLIHKPENIEYNISIENEVFKKESLSTSY